MVSLKKGQGISLRKDTNDLSQVTIGLGWDVVEKKGLFAGLFQAKQEDYDLDAVAFLCGRNGKVNDLGKSDPQRGPINGDIVFFNSMNHPSGCVRLTGDNQDGSGDGDDEQIIVDLARLPDRYEKIVIVVQIYQGIKRNQSFGGVVNAFVRAVDRKGTEMARFDLSEDPSAANTHSMVFAEINRESGGWKFVAVGRTYSEDSFGAILRRDYL